MYLFIYEYAVIAYNLQVPLALDVILITFVSMYCVRYVVDVGRPLSTVLFSLGHGHIL
jgi:hypothetical protein